MIERAQEQKLGAIRLLTDIIGFTFLSPLNYSYMFPLTTFAVLDTVEEEKNYSDEAKKITSKCEKYHIY